MLLSTIRFRSNLRSPKAGRFPTSRTGLFFLIFTEFFVPRSGGRFALVFFCWTCANWADEVEKDALQGYARLWDAIEAWAEISEGASDRRRRYIEEDILGKIKEG